MAIAVEKTCNRCAYWSKDDNDYELVGMRRCQCAKLSDGQLLSSEWDSQDRFDAILEKRRAENADMLRYQYSEGGGQFTGPKFGCIHWAARSGE